MLRAATMAGGAAVMYHAGKKTQAGRDQNAAQDADTEATTQAQQQEAPPAPAPAAPAGGMSSQALEELKQLGALHDQGVLTDEEFAAQKAKILGS